MMTFMHAFSASFFIRIKKGGSSALIAFSLPLFFLVDALALPNEDSLAPTVASSAESPYLNYAKKGSYENETMFSEVPQWHYYDMFGNKILDGFYMYGLSQDRNTVGSGFDNVTLHPLFLRWLNGLVQVGDIHDDAGILAMIGDRVRSKFTPWTFNQSLFTGARFDVFYKQNNCTFLTNRISHTGDYGGFIEANTQDSMADWLTGAHATHKFGDAADIGGTWVNIHHENSRAFNNPYSGVDDDTLSKKTPTGLSVYGLNFDVNLDKLHANGEYARSQEFLEGTFSPKGGDVVALNGHYDFGEKWSCGSELYTVGSRFKTDFSDPRFRNGDTKVADALTGSMGKYQYWLVEDNDDKDEFPENGRSRYANYTLNYLPGDPDGTIPASYDKNKNGIWDYRENFLGYDADPPQSQILFDRNNNGIPDAIEDDYYPDYPYVPSYYLPGERYYRYDDVDGKWEIKNADSLTQKGLVGMHLHARYNLLENLQVTVGGIFDHSQEKTFQMTYDTNGVAQHEVFAFENATSLYFLAHYKKDIDRDKYFMIENYFQKVQDNIPNHTVDFYMDPATGAPAYYLVVDKLDYRDMFGDALWGEFTLFRNRGFNYTGIGKFEFQKHFAHLDFNYPDENISSLTLINKCEYIYSLPFFKDMFLIPKYKNFWEMKGYGPNTSDSFDVKYRGNSMLNNAYLVLEWKMSEKTALTTGLQGQRFNDFINSDENYFEPCFSIQLLIKDRYAGMSMALTTGFSRYAYLYDNKNISHNSLNNPHRAVKNIDAHEIFIKLHAGI